MSNARLAVALFGLVVCVFGQPTCDFCCETGGGDESCRGERIGDSWTAPTGWCLIANANCDPPFTACAQCQALGSDGGVTETFCETVGGTVCNPRTEGLTAVATTAAPTAQETVFCDIPRPSTSNYPCTTEWPGNALAREIALYESSKMLTEDWDTPLDVAPYWNATLLDVLDTVLGDVDCLLAYFNPKHHTCFPRENVPSLGECTDSSIQSKIDTIDSLLDTIEEYSLLPTVQNKLQPYWSTWWTDITSCRTRYGTYFGTQAFTVPESMPLTATSTLSEIYQKIIFCESLGSLQYYSIDGDANIDTLPQVSACYGGCVIRKLYPYGCYVGLDDEEFDNTCESALFRSAFNSSWCPLVPTDAPSLFPTNSGTLGPTTYPATNAATNPDTGSITEAPTGVESLLPTVAPTTISPTTLPPTVAFTTLSPSASPTLPSNVGSCSSDLYLNKMPIGEIYMTLDSLTSLAECCSECETAGVDEDGIKHCSLWQWDGETCTLRRLFWKWANSVIRDGDDLTVGFVQNPTTCLEMLAAKGTSMSGSRAEGIIAVNGAGTEFNHRQGYPPERCCMKCWHWGAGEGQDCVGFRHASEFQSEPGEPIFYDRCAGFSSITTWDRSVAGWTSYAFSESSLPPSGS